MRINLKQNRNVYKPLFNYKYLTWAADNNCRRTEGENDGIESGMKVADA